MIVITGASGNIGRHLVTALRAGGAAMRACYRSEPDLRRAEASGVEARLIDFDRPGTLQAAFGGAATLFLLAPNGGRQLGQELNMLAAARRAGIRSIVKLSAWRAPEREFSFARTHREIECAIEGSGLAWTFLRPCGFMQNFSTTMGQAIREWSAIRLPAGDAKVAHIDVRDVAEVAARVLTTPGHAGQAYALSGPKAVSYGEAARILSQALGRAVAYVNLSEQQAKAEMLAAGLSPSYAAGVLDLFRAYRDGGGSEVTAGVERVLGRPPITFERFVQDHQGDFQ